MGDTRSRAIGAGKGATMARRAKACRACCVICAPIAAELRQLKRLLYNFGLQ